MKSLNRRPTRNDLRTVRALRAKQDEEDEAALGHGESPTPTYDERCQLWFSHHTNTWLPNTDAAADQLIQRMLADPDGDCLDAGDMEVNKAALERMQSKRPGFVIFVHVRDQVYEIPVGKGKQTFKWLALVAAQRYRAGTISHGRLRSRESGAQLRGNFVPMVLTTPTISTKTYVNPNLVIRRVLEDGDHVRVDLDCDRSDLGAQSQSRNYVPHLRDEHQEKPVIVGRFYDMLNDDRVTKFQANAFYHSRDAVSDRRKAQDEAEAVAEKEALEATKREATALFGDAAPASLDSIDDTFAAEWGLIDFPVFLPNAKSQAQLRPVMREHYVALRGAFKYYCQLVEDGSPSTGSLGKEELVLFCEAADLLDDSPGSKMKRKDLDKVFKKVNEEIVVSAGGGIFKQVGDEEFSRSEFLEALIHIAMAKFDQDFDDNEAMQFQYMLNEHVLPHIEEVVPNDDAGRFRQLMMEPENSAILLKYLNMLRNIFYIHSGVGGSRDEGKVRGKAGASPVGGGGDGVGGGGRGRRAECGHTTHIDTSNAEWLKRRDTAITSDVCSLSYSEWEGLLTEAGLISDKNLPQKAVRSVFLDVQVESFDVSSVLEQDETNLTRMSFVEFIEAIVRCTDCKWHATRIAWSTKLTICMNFLARCMPKPEPVRPGSGGAGGRAGSSRERRQHKHK